jgi:hypothetical protein
MSTDHQSPKTPLNRDDERLTAEAKALRDNLAKRKAQARGRRKAAETDESET